MQLELVAVGKILEHRQPGRGQGAEQCSEVLPQGTTGGARRTFHPGTSAVSNLFYQRHPQQLASVKLWHSIGNDKPLLPSLRARSLAYGWLVRGLTCLTCSPFRAGLDHSSWQVTLDHKGKTYYNSPFLNAWAELWGSLQKRKKTCDSPFMLTFDDLLEIVRCLSGLQKRVVLHFEQPGP